MALLQNKWRMCPSTHCHCLCFNPNHSCLLLAKYCLYDRISYLSSRPVLLVGIPVSRANFCFIFVMPNARLSENDTPGISDFLAILIIETVTAIRAFKFMNFTSIAMFQSCTPAASMAYGTTFWTTMSYLRTLISCPLADKEEKTSA